MQVTCNCQKRETKQAKEMEEVLWDVMWGSS